MGQPAYSSTKGHDGVSLGARPAAVERMGLVIIEACFGAEHGPAATEDDTMRTVLDLQFFQCVGERRAVSWYARRGALY